VPQAAAATGVSPTTARSHLKGCFERTGTHSQAELARLLASLPPVPSARPPARRRPGRPEGDAAPPPIR
jgi:hypothetical protein